MRILATGDWQLEYQTLDKAKFMIEEILDICERKSIDCVINLGDLKEMYNPIDVRVANFGVWSAQEFRRRNIDQLVLLGNHDRVNMYDDAQHWLGILEAAGAKVFDKPEVVSWDGKTHFHMLPFMTDKAKLKQAAKDLAEEADENSILVFHEDLRDCKYSQIAKSQSLFRTKDLYPNRYMFCIGGHIHMLQRVQGNVWYAGSGYAVDWGEANQKKGFLIVNTDKRKIFPVWSGQPRLYDPLWPGFEESKPENWDGAEVRIHVPYDNSVHDLSLLLTKAKMRGQKDYPGARILPVAEFMSDEKVDTFLDENSTDEEHVAEYVRQTCWDHLVVDKAKIVKYMIARLKAVGISARQNSQVQFIRAKGINFGSFKKLELDFLRKGITVLQGKNEDWRNRSNGSGKTTALQIPAVALFGQTFKGQKHDRWARRGSLKKAMAVVEFKTADGRLCKVIRWRRPHRLQLKEWNGEKWVDKSSGNSPKKTEILIEETIGFTWQTLANAIYIDQDRINALLSGTEGDRRKLLEQFQNLERYHLAQENVKKDLKKLVNAIAETEAEIVGGKSTIKNLEETIATLDVSAEKLLRREWEAADGKYKKAKEKAQDLLKSLEKTVNKLTKEQDTLEIQISQMHGDRGQIRGRQKYIEQQVKKTKDLEGECPTCKQQVTPKHIAGHVAKMKAEIQELEDRYNELNAEGDGYQDKLKNVEVKLDVIHEELQGRKDTITELKSEAASKYAEYDKIRASLQLRKEMQHRAASIQKKVDVHKENLDNQKIDQTFYEYCIEAFSRKGLPAFLNALLCPKLNRASEYYAKLFCDKVVQVRFESDSEGDFDVKVMNAFGGEHIEDQSRGELKMASLITSFALRDVSIITNLLNLDEPGEGLDSQNARRFAIAIRKLEPRFKSIWITSHNSSIIAELSGERTLVAVKRNGVSTLEKYDG